MSKMDRHKETAVNVVTTLQSAGHEAFFAGGCVRDALLGRPPKDYDVATNARPEQVEKLFDRTIAIGKAFGVIAVIAGKQTVEVATFRKDLGILDGRHPATIEFSAAKEDALRRDFTINGMFYDPVKDEVIDYVNGRRDLEAGLVAAIGNPDVRFQEDHLRMLRALRFSHTLEFRLEQATETAIRKMAPHIAKISMERIETELTRMLTDSPRPGDALRHLHEVGLLEPILPELLPMIGQEQPAEFHPEGDVFEHTCLMLNLMKEKKGHGAYTARELAYTVLLHDIGKPPTASYGPGSNGAARIRFNGHAAVGADLADQVLTRLRFPNSERKHIVDAIRGHMRFMEVQQMRTSTLRRLIGAETFDLEMELHRLDCLGSHAKLDNYAFIRDFEEQLASEPTLPEPWISGHDLIELGINEGKRIGQILKEAYDGQMENRFASRNELLEWVRSTYLENRD